LLRVHISVYAEQSEKPDEEQRNWDSGLYSKASRTVTRSSFYNYRGVKFKDVLTLLVSFILSLFLVAEFKSEKRYCAFLFTLAVHSRPLSQPLGG
jgi:hypothetical protein